MLAVSPYLSPRSFWGSIADDRIDFSGSVVEFIIRQKIWQALQNHALNKSYLQGQFMFSSDNGVVFNNGAKEF